jgi:hypothetical protein
MTNLDDIASDKDEDEDEDAESEEDNEDGDKGLEEDGNSSDTSDA